jgi:hypothetical protein
MVGVVVVPVGVSVLHLAVPVVVLVVPFVGIFLREQKLEHRNNCACLRTTCCPLQFKFQWLSEQLRHLVPNAFYVTSVLSYFRPSLIIAAQLQSAYCTVSVQLLPFTEFSLLIYFTLYV